jgi:hypothetical protein
VKALPRDATPVDFAYAIHTDVGHQCVGARVNGKMVPLRTRLRNGDIVEIVTDAGHKPSRDWLNFVDTSRGAQQDQALHPRRGEDPQPRARTQAVRQGGAAIRPQRDEDHGRERFNEVPDRGRGSRSRTSCSRECLRQAGGQGGAGEAGAARSS